MLHRRPRPWTAPGLARRAISVACVLLDGGSGRTMKAVDLGSGRTVRSRAPSATNAWSRSRGDLVRVDRPALPDRRGVRPLLRLGLPRQAGGRRGCAGPLGRRRGAGRGRLRGVGADRRSARGPVPGERRVGSDRYRARLQPGREHRVCGVRPGRRAAAIVDRRCVPPRVLPAGLHRPAVAPDRERPARAVRLASLDERRDRHPRRRDRPRPLRPDAHARPAHDGRPEHGQLARVSRRRSRLARCTGHFGRPAPVRRGPAGPRVPHSRRRRLAIRRHHVRDRLGPRHVRSRQHLGCHLAWR